MPQVQYVNMPSWGSALGDFLGGGLAGYQDASKKKEEEDAISQLSQRLKGKEGEDVLLDIMGAKNVSSDDKKTFATLFADMDLKKSKADQERQKKEQEESETEAILIEAGKTPEEAKKLKKTLSAQSARSLLTQANKLPPYEKQSDIRDANRIADYLDEVGAKGRNADRDILTLDMQDQLSDEGATGFKFSNALADYIQTNYGVDTAGMRDPRSEVYNSTSKRLMGFMADLVRGKVSDTEFKRLSAMISRAENTPQAAKMINEQMRLQRQIDKAEYEIVNQLEQEYKAKGESRPNNFDYLVSEKLKPVADALAKTSVNRIQNIFSGQKPMDEKKAAGMLDAYNKRKNRNGS